MSASLRLRFRFVLLVFACLATANIEYISHRVGICYAGSYVCWSLTDGLLVLPIAWPLSPTWGPWGLWLQEPWRGGGSFSSQAGCPTVSIPLIFIYWALLLAVVQPVVGLAMRLPPPAREMLKWAGNLAWISLWCGASYIDQEWAIVVSAVILPSVMLVFLDRRVARRKRLDPTPRCKACGYNLTGNVSGICPECGTHIATQSAR